MLYLNHRRVPDPDAYVAPIAAFSSLCWWNRPRHGTPFCFVPDPGARFGWRAMSQTEFEREIERGEE
jgi:hypothetical protein